MKGALALETKQGWLLRQRAAGTLLWALRRFNVWLVVPGEERALPDRLGEALTCDGVDPAGLTIETWTECREDMQIWGCSQKLALVGSTEAEGIRNDWDPESRWRVIAADEEGANGLERAWRRIEEASEAELHLIEQGIPGLPERHEKLVEAEIKARAHDRVKGIVEDYFKRSGWGRPPDEDLRGYVDVLVGKTSKAVQVASRALAHIEGRRGPLVTGACGHRFARTSVVGWQDSCVKCELGRFVDKGARVGREAAGNTEHLEDAGRTTLKAA